MKTVIIGGENVKVTRKNINQIINNKTVMGASTVYWAIKNYGFSLYEWSLITV